MISSGDNRPSLDMTADRLIDICVSLHRRQAVASIERELGISAVDLRRRLESLLTEGLVKRLPPGQFVPTCMVITIEDVEWMASPSDMVASLSRLIVDGLPEIRERSESIPAIRRAGFSRNTLLILSNVLLDNWQIRNVEREFLKTERPLRNGRRYYYALFEKPASQGTEAFGIYGNGVRSLGGIAVSVYGKQRYDGNTLLSISDADFKRLFGLSPQADISAEAKVLLERLALLARTGENRLEAREQAGLSALGLLENGALNVTVLHPSEAESLLKVAGLITPGLLDLLERHRSELESMYGRSPYKDEVTFSEFFMWWYHFFYTEVTNRLAQARFIDVPHSGNTTYIVAG